MIADAKHVRRWLPLAILLASTGSTEARPATSIDHEVRLGQCIRQAAGGRAWLEKTLWGLRDQEAGWIGAEVTNTNGTHDLGPLQVNSFWVSKLAALTRRSPRDVRFWLVNDACFNVRAARWIFLSGLSVTRDYWTAVGVYHSPTAWRQRHYAHSVAMKMQRRFGPGVFVSGKEASDAAE
ncbi:lytic transglycosylase domain-containing protein [Novosphingobium sp. CF614]|uniref:lytic transglycosylase domain-containing protein n=1 Tax=Novosphingobium sp. CF614 TaxID=1884364 RepID=UPI002101705A|nr:lytic transglycosylase domain-containing protein [Novosphingobium sp. CF614]